MKEQKGADTFGLAGFCWGGLISMKAAAHGADGGLKATACCHPARLTPELAEKASCRLGERRAAATIFFQEA